MAFPILWLAFALNFHGDVSMWFVSFFVLFLFGRNALFRHYFNAVVGEFS